MSGVAKPGRRRGTVPDSTDETGSTVSTVGVTAWSPAIEEVVGMSCNLHFIVMVGPQSFMLACTMFLSMEQGTETGVAGSGCAITHGVTAATSHNDTAVASTPRPSGFSLRWNQRNMTDSLA